MSEDELQEAIVDLAHVRGYRVAHFRPGQTKKGWRTAVAADGRGFPDLVIAKPGRIIFAELKTSIGITTDAQRAWQAALGDCAHIWTPRHWHDGTIKRVLEAAA